MTEADFSQYNVYQMAQLHGGAGFWMTRTTWDRTVARIVGIGEIVGPPPYFGNPPVVMDVYSKDGKLREELQQLSTAGTYKTWRLIDAPEWADAVSLRLLNDPAIAEAIAKLDRRHSRAPAVDEADKVFLKVSFEQKDKAKAIGAKWDPANKKWWIKTGDEMTLAKATKLGFVVTQRRQK